MLRCNDFCTHSTTVGEGARKFLARVPPIYVRGLDENRMSTGSDLAVDSQAFTSPGTSCGEDCDANVQIKKEEEKKKVASFTLEY